MVQRVMTSIGIVLSLTACGTAERIATASEQPTPVPSVIASVGPADQPYRVIFEGVDGTVEVRQEAGPVSMLVSLTGLNPKQMYELSFGSEDGAGAMFDANNATLITGTVHDETIFVPNPAGELTLRSRHPKRLAGNAGNGRVLLHRASPDYTLIATSPTIQVR